ncbi:hypothetical protein L2744_18025 [Shewanella profunda]|uniref:hypothetical protein n=1 Tax=Shewanella profunda TaxID=254793 RepID=UPI00200F02B7|nr:hypothetical protein [Shewanella profunda]MCL1091464.1 hypothetical protein [Shewanella profunda]
MKKCFYASLAEAQQATQALGIASQAEYQQRHLENPRLPSRPECDLFRQLAILAHIFR